MDPARFFTKKIVETNYYISDKTIQPDPIQQIMSQKEKKKRERHFADFYPAHPSWQNDGDRCCVLFKSGRVLLGTRPSGSSPSKLTFCDQMLTPPIFYSTLHCSRKFLSIIRAKKKGGTTRFLDSFIPLFFFFVQGGKRNFRPFVHIFIMEIYIFLPELSFQLPPIL